MKEELSEGVCFMCGGSCGLIDGEGEEDEEEWRCPLRTSLNVIFLLRNLLEVPRGELVGKLGEKGDNPGEWIRVCGGCGEMIKRARELDEERRIYEKELREDERKVVEMIRGSGGEGEEEDWVFIGNVFGDKIRAFVKQGSFVRKLKNVEVESPPFGEEEMAMPTKCFICECGLEDKEENEVDEEDDRLDVIFLLRIMLKVPSIYLEKQYGDCGGEVGNWVKFCGDCGRLTRTARQLDKDIRKIEGPLRGIQKQVIEKIRGLEGDVQENGEGNLRFEEKIKKFIINNNYSLNPNGDLNQLNPEEYLDYLKNPAKFKSVSNRPVPPPKEADRVEWIPKKSRITESGKFECGVCGKTYGKGKCWNWSEHFWKAHKIKELPCPMEECSMVFPSEQGDEFQAHWNMVHKGPAEEPGDGKSGPLICKICGIETSGQDSLYLHRKKVHKILESWKLYLKKKKKMAVKGPFLCGLCGKGFTFQSSLSTHRRVVHEKRFNLSCHVCGIGLANGWRLRKHLLVSHEEDEETRRLGEEEGLELSKCEVEGCRVVFIRREELDKHKELRHGGGGDGKMNWRFKCGICGRGFWKKDKWRGHEETHKGREERERKWACEICGGRFFSKKNLWSHNAKVHKKKKMSG